MPALRYPNRKFHPEPSWRSYTRTPVATTPAALRSWLLDRGSLTQRLIDASGGVFRVEVLNQGMALPLLSEARALGLPARQQALVREVVLYGCNEPWVYARSIIPVKTLTGRLRSLQKLDNRPLGALLFSDRSMQRGDIEIACMNTTAHLQPSLPKNIKGTIWGRRSIFYLDQKPLLVSEMFLPEFKPYNSPLMLHFHR
ncbi:MAG: chorismate lyase [Porticoccus sp.]|nr:chorismate lyase [Porticoccus sp.]